MVKGNNDKDENGTVKMAQVNMTQIKNTGENDMKSLLKYALLAKEIE